MKTTGFTTVNGDSPHAHAYEVDEYGNGKTIGMIGGGSAPHTHTIMDKKLSPSGFDNHTHRLAEGRVGPTVTDALEGT